jgi:glycosyltransferase involved in cell wall biosynthesis
MPLNHQPLVSVVLPTFNRATTLKRSIQSVLAQTYSNLELLVIDDCSVDNTIELIHAIKDPRLSYTRLEKNVGGAEARNVGIRISKGEIVAFQDSDDEWTCLKLEKSLSYLQSTLAIGAVCSAFIKVSKERIRHQPLVRRDLDRLLSYELLLMRNLVGTPTLVARKELLLDLGGFDASMPRFQDWELALRLTQRTDLLFIDEPLIISYVTENSISHNKKARAIALTKLYEKHKETIEKSVALQSQWLHRIGDASLLCGMNKGRALLVGAWIKHPLNIRYLFKAILAIPESSNLYIRTLDSVSVVKNVLIRLLSIFR